MDKDSLPTEYPIYITRSTSVPAAIIGCIIMAAGIASALFIFTSNPGVITAIASLAIVAAVIYAIIRIQQKIEVTVLTDRLVVRYIQKSIFDDEQDREILLTDIDSYKTEAFNGRFFTLYMKDDSKLKFRSGPLSNSNDFSAMTDKIINTIEHRNQDETAPLITEKESIYEGKSGIVLAIIAATAILLFIYAIVCLPGQHSKSDVIRGLGITCTLLALLAHIISLRYKNKRKPN